MTTGPQEDSPYCPPEGEECPCSSNCDDYTKKPTNSINKALVIDYESRKIIACTNLFQGHCEKRHLEDISEMDEHIFKSIVPNDEISPAVVFIGPGPSDTSQGPFMDTGQKPQPQVLYVAATRSTKGLNLYRDLVPHLSSRSLSTFDIASSDFSSATKIELESQRRDSFRVLFVDGFGSGGFSYFLANQPAVLDAQNSKYVSKIMRICQNDRNYYSFVEVSLECTHNNHRYNLIQAIDVAHPGSHLARNLGLSHLPPLTDMEDVLFAVFAKSERDSSQPINDSAICVYPLQKIRRKFTENTQDCFQGVGNTGPAHISSPDACIKTVSQLNVC